MLVTKIERQKRQRQRVNLFLDGEFAFGLHEEILLKAKIHVGDTLDPATIDIIKTHEEAKLAKESALRLISRRFRTEKELRFMLLGREYDPAVVDNVIHELQTKGYVDDRKFAAAYIRDARLRKPTGTRRLFQQLRLKGLDRDLVMEALQENLTVDNEADLAYTTAMNRLKFLRTSRKPVPAEKQKKRLAEYLAHRGFPWSTIRPVLRRVFATAIDAELT